MCIQTASKNMKSTTLHNKVHIKNRIVLYNVSSISNGNLLRMFGLIKFSLIPGFWCFLSIWWNTSPTCVFFVLTKGLASLQYYTNFQNMYIMAKSCKKLINRCRLIVNCIIYLRTNRLFHSIEQKSSFFIISFYFVNQ